jgi:hypothetical protein
VTYHPKTGAQAFDSDWQQTVAWAQSNGIPAASYLPVYQLDQTRIANGEDPMGRAERNLAILAAHNPNQVSSAPADNPSPSHVWSNAVSDAGKIATGLEGIFTGSFEKSIYHSAVTTWGAVAHPSSEAFHGTGSQAGINSFMGTIGNWLNNTLLSYAPGAADLGTILSTDAATHYGPGQGPLSDPGGEKLAQHPLMSLLDLIPGEGGLAERGARAAGYAGIADKLAARGGDQSIFKAASSRIAGATLGGKPGVTITGTLKDKLNLNDRVQNMLGSVGKGAIQVGPAISAIGEAFQAASSMSTDNYTWLLGKSTADLKDLNTRAEKGDGSAVQELETIRKILDTRRTSGGDSVRQAMMDPAISPAVKQILKDWLNGPLRFATEEEIFGGAIRPTVDVEGRTGLWAPTGASARKVLATAAGRRAAEMEAVRTMDELEPMVDRTKALLSMLPKAMGQWTKALADARRQVFSDPALQTPLTRPVSDPSRFRQAASLSKRDQLHAVVGEGGLADQLIEQVRRNRDPDQIGELAKAMKSRLSQWGPKSVRAADHPALMALYQTADAFEQWAEAYRKNAKEIDKLVYGAEKSRAHFAREQDIYRTTQRTMLRDRHKLAGENLLEGYRRIKARGASKLVALENKEGENLAWITELADRDVEATAARGTRAETMKAAKMARIKKYEAKQAMVARLRAARRQLKQDNDLAWAKYQRDRLKLTRDNASELARFDKARAGEKAGMGEELAAAVRLGSRIREFHEAVADNPADQFKNVYRALMEKHMTAQLETSALAQLTDEYLRNIPQMTEKRLAEISSNPEVLTEYAMAYFHEIMNQPDLDPELAEEARDEARQYSEDARQELKQLIGQGLRVPYIPSAVSFDERLGRNSMAPLIGHGIPTPDLAKAKVWDYTPHKEDFALGINKAVVQALQRDATIHLVEDTLRPMTLTKAQVQEFATAVLKPEAGEGNIADELSKIAAEKLGLTKVNFESMFGFGLPRWGKDEVYLPTPVVRTLEKLEKSRRAGVLKTSNKIFRYSILGLSPRYTAHVVFGGTMMLALRSSPYALTMIGDAARGLRDGTIPHGIGRANVEEGFEEPVRMMQTQVGRDLHNMVIGEHMETVQKVARGAAKPVHALRAAADVNFRFTRYVRDLQAAVAYLDGAAKYERKAGGKMEVEDPETGKMVRVSPERAVKEGMHHVQEVFGNLQRMSPFERQVAQSIMPFYGWQKHILGYVMSFPFDHPWRSLILSQMAYNASNQVPLGYPIRIQLLFPVGGPDKSGNQNAIDIRSLDPFRDVANYGTMTGFFESLNPAIGAGLSVPFGSQAVYGESSLYPGVSYNAFYGIDTANSGGSWVTALEQWTPQVGAVVSALQSTSNVRSEWTTDRSAAVKSMLEALNIPFFTPPINLKQIAAKDETARYESAYKASQAAFGSGDFSGLQGYKTVPNPLNPAYEISPAQLEALYKAQAAAVPGVAPIESLLPPPSPPGY